MEPKTEPKVGNKEFKLPQAAAPSDSSSVGNDFSMFEDLNGPEPAVASSVPKDQTVVVVPTTEVDDELPINAAFAIKNRPSAQTYSSVRSSGRTRQENTNALPPSKLRESFGSFEDADIEEYPKKKRHCWCFKSMMVCLSVILAILVGLGILLYFIFPAPPVIEMSDPFQPENSRGFLVNNKSISELATDILREPLLVLSIGLATTVQFNSTSYITVGIKKVDMTAGIKDGLGQIIPDFSANGQVSDLRLPARTSSNFTFVTFTD